MTLQQHDAWQDGDDLIQPFMIELSGIRGRMMRAGAPIDTILTRGGYPEPVAKLLGELLALGTVLASTLKYDGVFTLQVKGDGPVHTMVMDVTSDNALRGYAGFDAEAVARLAADETAVAGRVATWLGRGHMAFTVDQGVGTQRYQGLVELVGDSLTDCLLHYFRQSQQINAGILVNAERGDDGWRAGALLIEQVPESADGARDEVSEEDWRRALVFAASCTGEEMLDPALSSRRLLYRLFHEDGVRVFEPRPISVGCRCSRDRVAGILGSLPPDEVRDMMVDGAVVMTCEFCSIDFRFDEAALDAIFAGAGSAA